MARVNCEIDSVIDFLQKKKEEGYKTVELIDDARAYGWQNIDGTPDDLIFISNKKEPTVLGIDARVHRFGK